MRLRQLAGRVQTASQGREPATPHPVPLAMEGLRGYTARRRTRSGRGREAAGGDAGEGELLVPRSRRECLLQEVDPAALPSLHFCLPPRHIADASSSFTAQRGTAWTALRTDASDPRSLEAGDGRRPAARERESSYRRQGTAEVIACVCMGCWRIIVESGADFLAPAQVGPGAVTLALLQPG